MYKPFRFFGDSRAPSQGFFHVINHVKENPVAVGFEEVEFEFSATEMKAMYRPSLEIEVYDKQGEIEIRSVGVLGTKLIVQLNRRTGVRPHIKARWVERYLYAS